MAALATKTEKDSVSTDVVPESRDDSATDGSVQQEKRSVTDQWFKDLVNRWKKHNGVDLQLRYQTGAELNLKIGLPTVKQDRFAEVVKMFAAEIQVDPSEVYRMRQFAFIFDQYGVFEFEHPEVKSWARVKAELPKWYAKATGKEPPAKTSKTSDKVKRVVRALATATKGLQAEDLEFQPDDRVDLTAALKKFGNALTAKQDNLGVKVLIKELSEVAVD